jgi:peptidase E
VPERQILAFGGGGLEPEHEPLRRHLLGLAAGNGRPRVLFVPTASAESRDYLVRIYAAFSPLAEVSHAEFFPWPRPDLREHALSRDLIYVGGGNTANMLALWRLHGFDAVLREAWERGVVLAGVSAGMICWFEAGVTDSFGPQLEGMRDGLGLLPGSACPHYDGEERRRPVYTSLVADGFPPGWAAEDGVALHFAGTDLREAVTWRGGARAYRVEAGGETPLDARLLR